jgi:PIN domain nuclease of toxin-antitoxin system
VKLLLDTHIWLWSLLAPERLIPRVATALERPDNELWLSPLSTWELLVLVERRRVVLDQATDAWIAEAMARAPLKEAPLTHEVALETRHGGLSHRDPVDTFLVATARVFGLTLVTADARIIGAKGVSILANR